MNYIRQGQHAGSPLDVVTARARLLDAVAALAGTDTLPLPQAAGRILAIPVSADCDVPLADNSAMDGYALRCADLESAGGALPLAGRLAAGQATPPLAPGHAVRIFTGAVIPEGADAVVMQERCRRENNTVHIQGSVRPGDNIRRAGEDIARGSEILPAGRRLRPQDLGLAASVGHAELAVHRRPRVAMLATGDELVPPGQPLRSGQIYESNSAVLAAMLQALGCDVAPLKRVPDTLDDTRQALHSAATDADLVISSGGVSVGDEDHVKAAVEALGRLDLWKVAVKPGKPLAFGQVHGVPFLGLPGNPVSLLVTFLLFGAPLVRKLQGCDRYFPSPLPLPAGFAREHPITREEYLRVRIDQGRLVAYPHQGSGVLSSAAWADGLARVPAGTTVAEGDLLEYFSFETLGG